LDCGESVQANASTPLPELHLLDFSRMHYLCQKIVSIYAV
jgi:hypothetical protein